MRRFLALLTTTTIVLGLGCGTRSYEKRLEKTLELMKYHKQLDDNLMAPAKDKLELNLVYIRPPKSLTKMADFSLTVLDPGKFDIAETFDEKDVQKLHILVRVQKVKDPKKKAQAETTNRGEFNADVVNILSNVFSVDIDLSKSKEQSKKTNKFKHVTFEANGKVIQAFLPLPKSDPPNVALIFEYPKSEEKALARKIELCLEAYRTGPAAKFAFDGGEITDTAEGAPASGGSAAF